MRKIINSVKSKLFNRKGAKFSFSQAGEDLVLQRIFLGEETGFYVDVGAYHPFKLSNTFLFYLNGWRGINIDARPGSKQLFDRYRPRDINLEVGISDTPGLFDYHIFEEDTLNRFAFSKSMVPEKATGIVVQVRAAPLSSILDEHAPGSIDFITIDTEGTEYHVLKSINWMEFSPRVILIEHHSDNSDFNKIVVFLKEQRYNEFYRIPVNSRADSVFFLKG